MIGTENCVVGWVISAVVSQSKTQSKTTAPIVQNSKSQAASQDEFTRLTAIKWLREFIALAAAPLAPQYAAMLGVILPNISHSSRDILQVMSGERLLAVGAIGAR